MNTYHLKYNGSVKIILLSLKHLRKMVKSIKKRLFGKDQRFIDIQYTGQEASDLIYEYISNDKPCMIARFGKTELRCVVNYLGLTERNIKNYFRYIKGDNIYFEFERRNAMRNNAGFFPENDENLIKFSQLMLDCIPDIDILGSWTQDEFLIKEKIENVKTVHFLDLEPYYHNNPWTRALEGKTVLIIHPFTKSIENQYLKRDKLFENKNILPKFKLETVKAVQSIAYNDCGYKDWFDALEAMKSQINEKEYDIAIIGCGAYGFPLASFVKRQGKKAVHLGGATQMLFGIKGHRWEDEYKIIFQTLCNEHWIRPSAEETPTNNKNVENGCYW